MNRRSFLSLVATLPLVGKYGKTALPEPVGTAVGTGASASGNGSVVIGYNATTTATIATLTNATCRIYYANDGGFYSTGGVTISQL